MNLLSVSIKEFPILFFCLALVLVVSCKDDDIDEPAPPYTGLESDVIVIRNIQSIPDTVTFNRVSAEITGKWWKVIARVEGTYDGKSISLQLPASLDSDLLSPSAWDREQYGLGYWPAASTDSLAGVAGLGDIIAYDGDEAVGMLTYTDWNGEGSSLDKAFVYYQYAEREFKLSGINKPFEYSEMFGSSYFYTATFKPGWNAYANITPARDFGYINCTTNIPEGLNLKWYFKAW